MTPILKSIFRLTFSLLLFEFHATLSNAQVSDEHFKQDLLNIEKRLITKLRAHDTTALKDIIANEYQLVLPNIQTVPHDQWLRNCFEWVFDSATIEQISVTKWEQVAVFRSLQHFYNLVIGDDPPIAKGEAWVTDLWIKRNEKWQILTRVSERTPRK